MICLTKILGTKIYINEDNIQWIENNPDTTITFMNGTKLIVRETLKDIYQRLNNSEEQKNDTEWEGSVSNNEGNSFTSEDTASLV